MLKSKGVLAAGSVAGAFILVYGTAVLFRLVAGGYLFEGGLANLNYALLAILCAVPFALVALFGRNDSVTRGAVAGGALLFSVIFILVHFVLVLSAEAMDGAGIVRTMVVFPASALLLAGTVYLSAGRKKAA
ncbi:hypothetical protein [Planococcus sp. CAU13]|uniref:hypothetical protein n=1 Tax=Planococcus sp. CAU13 TaxID=1541197 RepID=UPI00053005D7|nr:hypothetical protein [Planococcus sp. CAU13]